ncbi:MAG: PilZ domain-containing protein [Bacteriovoracaceae bacterium]|nr:PilZ domain-containing protein [Bacteriovoracaceae bacterium]
MDRAFNLIKSEFLTHEKRLLPRFPYCYMTFKAKGPEHVFEVSDISVTGMQLSLRDGKHELDFGDAISGTLHWSGLEHTVTAKVRWLTNSRLGVEFDWDNSNAEMSKFLCAENIAKNIKPIHQFAGDQLEIEIPGSLKYWLRADGPMEVFVWTHSDGEFSKVQIIMMQNFIEWEDGQGLSTGRTLSKRDMDTPLIHEDEFVFKMDSEVDTNKMDFSGEILKLISEDFLPADTVQFILRKLEHS